MDQSSLIDQAVREQLLVLDGDLFVRAASKSFYSAFRIAPEQLLGKQLAELNNGQWEVPAILSLLNETLQKGANSGGGGPEHEFTIAERGTLLVRAWRLASNEAQNGMIVLSCREAGAQKSKNKNRRVPAQ